MGRCFPGIPQQWPIRGVHVASLRTCGFKHIWCVQNVLFGQSELLLSWLAPKLYRHVIFGEFVWCDKVFLAHLKHFLLQMRICHFFKKPWFLLVEKGVSLGLDCCGLRVCSYPLRSLAIRVWEPLEVQSLLWSWLAQPSRICWFFWVLRSLRCPITSVFFCTSADVMQLLFPSRFAPTHLLFGGCGDIAG